MAEEQPPPVPKGHLRIEVEKGGYKSTSQGPAEAAMQLTETFLDWMDSPARVGVTYLTQVEVDALACAVARSVDPTTQVTNAHEASAVIWSHHEQAGPILCSLATMLAEMF